MKFIKDDEVYARSQISTALTQKPRKKLTN